MPLVIGWNMTLCGLKSFSNLCSMRLMILWRRGRPYYSIACLDQRVDVPDARITNDVDLLLQHLFEFVFGGILKPEEGSIGNLSVVYFSLAALLSDTADTETRFYVLVGFLFLMLLCLVPLGFR